MLQDMNYPSVSIILPTYNRAELLEGIVGSVLAQTFNNWELIISDDGSGDNTPQVVKDMIDKDNRIRYNKNLQNQGLPKNRNIGISLAKNELILFVEDDLILDELCLEVLVRTYAHLKNKNKPVGCVAPRLITNFLNNPRTNITNKNIFISRFNKMTGLRVDNFSIILPDIMETNNVHACSLYPKGVLLEVGCYEENDYKGTYAYEEVDLNCKIRMKGYKLYFDSKAVAYHIMAKKGGCRVSSQLIRDYYYFRNHIIFLKKFYGMRSIYMVPCFIFHALLIYFKNYYNLLR